jgi:hypothetical protein
MSKVMQNASEKRSRRLPKWQCSTGNTLW